MTIFEAYEDTKKKLKAAGIEDNVFEARQIIKHITGLTAAEILTCYTKPLTLFQQNNLTALLRQREIRYPLQYILGEWDFYGRSYFVGPGVLVPRGDTEVVAEACLEFLKDKEKPTVLDLCAGSGCIGITLAKEIPDSSVILVEKYEEALRYTQKNALKNEAFNAAAMKGDIFEGAFSEGKYDLVVSNPPYIPKEEMAITSPETAFEPETALLAGDGGMEFYKAIIKNYTKSLKEGGMLCFEVGVGKARAVADLLEEAGFGSIKLKKDLNGIDRGVSGIKHKENENG